MKALKLSKTSWISLSVGVFIVIVASLGLTRSQQLREQAQVDEELSVAEMRINNLQVKQLHQKQEELQKELDESITQHTTAQDSLRQSIESIDVTDKFFAISYSCGVEVTSISTSTIKSDKLVDVACSMITLNAVVVGDLYDLINFIIRLNTDFTTGIVNSAQIAIPPGCGDDESSLNIKMSFYAYKGD